MIDMAFHKLLTYTIWLILVTTPWSSTLNYWSYKRGGNGDAARLNSLPKGLPQRRGRGSPDKHDCKDPILTPEFCVASTVYLRNTDLPPNNWLHGGSCVVSHNLPTVPSLLGDKADRAWVLRSKLDEMLLFYCVPKLVISSPEQRVKVIPQLWRGLKYHMWSA